MTAAERKALREARAAQTAVCDECKLTGAHAEGCSKRPPAPRNLDDPATQEAILEPQPIEVTIDGKPVELFPLPAKEQRALTFSFVPKIMRAASEAGALDLDKLDANQRGLAVVSRYGRALAEDEALAEQFAHFIARSEHAPDTDPDPELLKTRAALIDKTMKPFELVVAFTQLAMLNEVFGVTDPRKGQPKKTT